MTVGVEGLPELIVVDAAHPPAGFDLDEDLFGQVALDVAAVLREVHLVGAAAAEERSNTLRPA